MRDTAPRHQKAPAPLCSKSNLFQIRRIHSPNATGIERDKVPSARLRPPQKSRCCPAKGPPTGSLSRVRFLPCVGFCACFPIGFWWGFRLGFKVFAHALDCVYPLCRVGLSVSRHHVSYCSKIDKLKDFYLHAFTHVTVILAIETLQFCLTLGLSGLYSSGVRNMLSRQTQFDKLTFTAGMVRSKSAETPALCRPSFSKGVSAMTAQERRAEALTRACTGQT